MRSCRRLSTLVLLAVFAAVAAAQPQEAPRNIIVMIGDGMGVGQLSALVLANPEAAVLDFPVAGFSATQSATDFVTESAAGGTALSSGYRISDDAIGVLPDGRSVQTLLEFAREHGKSTGVISTSSVTHATPASFLTHVSSRKLEFDIAAQMAVSGADVMFGGGLEWFLPSGKGGKRTDGRDLLDEMRAAGYTISTGPGFENPDAGKSIWLISDDGMPAAPGRRPGSREMLERALDILSRNERGFVLMLEGSQIDWAAHDNDFPVMQAELLDFDEAMRGALDFAERDANTLVVVTADHETGGLALLGEKPDGSDMRASWINKSHTGALVPVLAFGPAAMQFGGIHRNDEIGRMLFRLIGPKEF